MDREQMIAWLTLEGWEYKQYQYDETASHSHFVVSNTTEWIKSSTEEDSYWRSLPRHVDDKEYPAPWDSLPDADLKSLMEILGK